LKKLVQPINSTLALYTHCFMLRIKGVLKSFQIQGFVMRQEHAIDTRAKEVALAKNGIKLLEKANKIIKSIDNQYFTKVKKDKLVSKKLMQTLIQ
jgi:DNA-binding MarR family transcriptional regulator